MALLATGCGDDAQPQSAVEIGAALGDDPALGGVGNPFACTTCHATDDGDTDLYPGYSLIDSAFRASWWGGYERSLLSATNFCVQYFMGGAPIDPESADGRALYAWLVAMSPENPSPALPLTVVENVSLPARGDPARGETVYLGACLGCNGAVHTGDGRLAHPTLSGDDIVLPEWTDGYGEDFPGVEPALVVVEKVRHGQFFLVGGNMPLFSREALSDEDLGALLAFLGL